MRLNARQHSIASVWQSHRGNTIFDKEKGDPEKSRLWKIRYKQTSIYQLRKIKIK